MRNRKLIIIFSILLSITTLVLLSSIIFSVKTVSAYCYNYKDYLVEQDGISLNSRLLSSINLKGKSIFLLKDEEIILQIEQDNPDIKVIELVRLFPNRVEINYVRMYNYFEIKGENNTYYQLRCDGRITSILSEPSTENRIRIISPLNGTYNQGDYIFSSENRQFFLSVVTAFEMLNLGENKASTLFEYIDISTDIIHIGIRNTDTTIKIYNHNDFFKKLHSAYSYYNSEHFLQTHKTILVDNNLNVFSS